MTACTCPDPADALRAALEGRDHECSTATTLEAVGHLPSDHTPGQAFALNDHDAIVTAILGGHANT